MADFCHTLHVSLPSRFFINFLLIVFWPLTAFILYLDSTDLAKYFDGQILANLLAPLFLALLVLKLPIEQRLPVLLFVPLSAFGEALFSLAFKLYEYRLGGVPLYVPFGHSILLGIGLLLAHSTLVLQHELRVRRWLLCFHGALIVSAWAWFGDSLSLLWGGAFFAFWFAREKKQKARTFSLIVGVLVLYIELLGTHWNCWNWAPRPWNLLHTVNPPVGAFAAYVVGELHAIRCAHQLAARWNQWKLARGEFGAEGTA
jgi:hypothetical protein